MQILVHIGLNKCASTYIQQALERAHQPLSKAGVWYPWQDGPPCQYGLSRHYGFGPVADGVVPVSIGDLIAEARLAGCSKMIVSSEYLSLYRPQAVARLVAETASAGAQARAVVFRRALLPWVRSLFNQYVKTVDGGRHLASIDAFVEQVLHNRAVEIARRIKQWQDSLGAGRVQLHEFAEGAPERLVLEPLARFAGRSIPEPPAARENASLDADRLHWIGQLRQRPPCPARDAEISRVLAGGPAGAPAPEGYLRLSPALHQRLVREIGTAADALGWREIQEALPLTGS